MALRAMRWMPLVLAVAAVAALVLALTLPTDPPVSGGPGASRDPGASESPVSVPSATPAGPLSVEAAGYAGPQFDTNLVVEPTEYSVQSKLWFHDGSWWGILVSSTTGQLHVHELLWETQHWLDTGVVVDERPFARVDALADGTDLYLAASGSRNSSSHAVRVSRFSYDAEVRRYRLEPDFPRTITAGGVGPVTLAKSPDGGLWVAYVAGGRVRVDTSTTRGVTWVGATELPVEEAQATAERAAVVATDEHVAVVWTNLNDDRLFVAEHRPGDAADAWTAYGTTVDGLRYGTDQLSVGAASDGTIFIAVRSSLDEAPNRNPDAPQLVLARLRGSEWTQAVVGRVRDEHVSPYLVVDDALNRAFVFAEAEGDVYLKHADLDVLSFPTGRGKLLLRATATAAAGASPTPAPTLPADAEPVLPEMAHVTSAKSLDDATEIVVVATEETTGRYGHAVTAVPGGRAVPQADGHAAPMPDGVTQGLPVGSTTYLFRDSFSPFSPGPGTVSGWETRDDAADIVMTIAEPAPGDPALRLAPNALGDGPAACKGFASVSAGQVTVRTTVQTRGTPDSDSVITELRGADGVVAEVRFGEPGVLRYFAGDERVNTTVPYQPGTWYWSTVVLDIDEQSYDWFVTPLGQTSRILELVDIPLRVPATSVDEVCLAAANQLPGGNVELYVDDVSVERGPGG